MAEALSVLGIFHLAHELATSVLAIKKFCEDVKDAPAELLEVVDHIDAVSSIVSALSEEASSGPEILDTGDILQQSLGPCKKVIARLRLLVFDVQRSVASKPRRTALVMLWKQGALDKLIQKLDRSKHDLGLAHQVFVEARRQLAEARSAAMLQKISSSIQDWQVAHETLVRNIQKPADATSHSRTAAEPRPVARLEPYIGTKIERHESETKLCVRFPTWLCQSTWRFCFVRAAGRWDLSLTTSRQLPDNHEMLRAIINKPLEHFVDLLQSRMASIRDVTEKDETLLDVGDKFFHHCVTRRLSFADSHHALPY